MIDPLLSPRVVGRRWFVVLAFAAMAFIVYGSFVPFEYRPRPWSEAWAEYKWALPERFLPGSRSDFIANIVLGIPLGFALVGAFRVDRSGIGGTLVAGVGAVVIGTVLAATVEFGQLFFPGRYCTGSDVWAQGLGSLIGAIGWMVCGQWATNRLRAALSAHAIPSSTAPLLAGYTAIVLLVQTLPLDLTANARVIYHRLRDPEKVTFVPFDELVDHPGRPPVDEYKKLADWLELILLVAPAGVLASGLPGRFRSANGLFVVAGCGLIGMGVSETVQVLVLSRHASTTDILVGGLGFVLGWAYARVLSDRGVRKYRTEVALATGQVLFAALAVIHWQPFDFFPKLLEPRSAAINWMPLAGQATKNYLWALNETATKLLLFVPLGAVVVWGSKKHHLRSRTLWAAIGCGMVSVILELGQGMLPTRYLSPTDVIFGLMGGLLGGELTRRALGEARIRVVRTKNPEMPAPLPAPPPMLPPTIPGEPWWAAAERMFPRSEFPAEPPPIRVIRPGDPAGGS